MRDVPAAAAAGSGAATAGEGSPASGAATAGAAGGGAPAGETRDVFSTFAGAVEVVDVLVQVGDRVEAGAVIAAVEAMKAKHDIRTPHGGTVQAVHVKVGDEIDSRKPLITVG
jgi:biotin carboxyl carrier protein